MAALFVRLLGPVEVVVGSEPVPLPAAKYRALLALLAIDANTPVPTESLVERLWVGRPPATAGSVLRTYVSRLRHALPDGPDRLLRTAGGYQLNLADDELDSAVFTAKVTAATTLGVRPHEAVRLLRSALALWRGPALREVADDPRAAAEVARLDAARWSAVEILADAELELGSPDAAVAVLQAAVAEEPLREPLVARLVLALDRCGRQGDALAACRRLRVALSEELGVDPSPQLRQLEVQVLQQDPVLDGSPRRGNVPTPLTALVAREAELRRVVAALADHRLVTLTGPGGSGKTRLAIAAADDPGRWPDGAWFVDLASRRDAGDVPAAALAALGVPQRTSEDPGTTLLTFVAGRRLLLVVDNCEHLRSACADLVVRLVQGAPQVTVLATSRSPLGAAGELVLAVPPLAVPEPADDSAAVQRSPAGQLLSQRVASARGGRGPLDHEWPAVGELCRRLDGLPLALELVAATSSALSLSDVAGGVLNQLFELEQASEPHHHAGLAGSVQWSLALLPAPAREVLQRLSLLPGPFSVEAAAAAAGRGRDDVVVALRQLVDASLLEPVSIGSSRFRLLETVRQVVRRTVDDATATAALDRLTAWAADWTEELEPALRGPAGVHSLDLLDDELAVLHAALDHGLSRADPQQGVRIAASMSAVWAYRGYVIEGQQRLDRALTVAGPVPPALRVRLMLAAGTHHMVMGDLDGFGRLVDAALRLARDAAGTADMLKALLWAARALLLRGARAGARGLYDEALSLAQAADDPSAAASALAGLGDVAAAGGSLDTADDLHRRSLALFRAAGDVHGEGQALLNLAETHRLAGNLADADAAFADARATFARIADRSCLAACDQGRARVACDEGRTDDAVTLLRAVLAVRRDLGQERLADAVARALAHVLADAGRPEDAAEARAANREPVSG
ncbi:MAG: BTAD domain-containing putative transcriptional regulator [Actinomycetes bacterium]